MNTTEHPQIAVLGTGKMATALVRGWLLSGVAEPGKVRLYNRTATKALLLSEATECVLANTPDEAVQGADVVLLGVKPYAVVPVLQSVRDALSPECLVVSVAAGVPVRTLEENLRRNTPVLRVMPNTPALVGAGASAFCRGTHATDRHTEMANQLFSAVGSVVEVTEEQIDAVIGVSGSGVAYFYLFIEALIDGGVRAGLPRDVARQLAAQTALGAGRMVLETNDHPGALKDAVTTPGGTTIAALEVLETDGVRGSIIQAVLAARDRAQELAS
ncbi:MAG: pyrroline-5-carboxylate reductase [Armatimonadaceae bacterium]